MSPEAAKRGVGEEMSVPAGVSDVFVLYLAVKPNDAFWSPSSPGSESFGSDVGPPGTMYPVPAIEPADGSYETKEADDSATNPTSSTAQTSTLDRSGHSATNDAV